jgi:hypothetical protein
VHIARNAIGHKPARQHSPRRLERDSPFDILLGFSWGLAKIGTLDGQAHISPPENAKLAGFSDGFIWRIIA